MDEKFRKVLDHAIREEEQAAAFYRELAEKVKEPHVRDTLLDFAKQEQGHKTKLEAVRDGRIVAKAQTKVVDLKLSDYLVEVEPNEQLSFQGALIIAMKKEKAAFRMYSDMAASCEDAELRDLFLHLAHEEANHKLKFEIEYDDLIYQEN